MQNPPPWTEKQQTSHLISNSYRKQLTHEETHPTVITRAVSLTYPVMLATMTDGNLKITVLIC